MVYFAAWPRKGTKPNSLTLQPLSRQNQNEKCSLTEIVYRCTIGVGGVDRVDRVDGRGVGGNEGGSRGLVCGCIEYQVRSKT